jgi:hypothetical protein
MTVRTIHARGAKGSSQVEQLVQQARTQAGVERILVVYEAQAAHIYVEGEAPSRPRPQARTVLA